LEANVRKILLLMLIALPVLAGAQSYSRWNYSDSQPNNAAADAAMVAFYAAAMANHGQGEVKLFQSYRYPAQTDSSFELFDVSAKIMRLFDPTPAPDGATELAREDTVTILIKQSPLKKRQMVGGDGILPPGQSVRPLDTFMAWAARKEAQALRKAVDDSIRVNPSAGNTKAKRAKVWLAIKKQKKDKKIKAPKLGKTN
jgi:hypothetical protein